MSSKRQAKSCYARHHKAPYKYSEAYERWHRAPDEEARQRADVQFRRLYGIPTWDVDPESGYVRNFPRTPWARNDNRHPRTRTRAAA